MAQAHLWVLEEICWSIESNVWLRVSLCCYGSWNWSCVILQKIARSERDSSLGDWCTILGRSLQLQNSTLLQFDKFNWQMALMWVFFAIVLFVLSSDLTIDFCAKCCIYVHLLLFPENCEMIWPNRVIYHSIWKAEARCPQHVLFLPSGQLVSGCTLVASRFVQHKTAPSGRPTFQTI